MRRQLWKIHNGKDVLVPCACRWFQPGTVGYDDRCAEDEVEFEKHSYTDLATNTKFSLVVEGFGLHSFRLTEALGSGSIPVILVDHYVLYDTTRVRVFVVHEDPISMSSQSPLKVGRFASNLI